LKIEELKEGMKRVNVVGKIVQKSDTREVRSRYKDETYRVADALIDDDSGTIKLTLWNEQIDRVNVNDRVKIENGYITTFRGEIQLNVGRYGTLSIV
jgi:replication factor A1